MGRTRRTFSAQQKTQIALEALRERQTLSEIAQKHEVHPSQITAWKKLATEGLPTLFEQARKDDANLQEEKIALLYQQIGQLQFELDWLKKKQPSTDVAYLRTLIESHPTLSIQRQCELLGLSRSVFYYTPVGETKQNLHYMKLMDKQYLDTPFFGVGQFTDWLRAKGHVVNPKRVRRLLRLMGLSAICPGPHTSKPGTGGAHKVYPYLLRELTINQVGQVYGTDITYIPLEGGFLYLTAFIDWFSRYVLSWELSKSLDTSFCLLAFERACAVGKPQIVNTDQGAQYTSLAFSERVVGAGIALSMDGKGRAIDNVFTERLWRSLKYEEVYLKSYRDGQDAWQQLDRYIRWYNEERTHSWLGGLTPKRVFEM